MGTTPLTSLLFASLRVIVTVDVDAPFAVTGPVPVMVELAAKAAPAWNTTVPPALTTGVAMLKVLVSALVEAKVQVATPEALEAPQVP